MLCAANVRAFVFAVCVLEQVLANVVPDDDIPQVCDLGKYETWKKLQGVAMLKNERDCRYQLNELRLRVAGWWGPVKEEDIYDVMCSNACLTNDAMHEEAMEESACNCVELSTKRSNLEADFCAGNSARMLCHQYKPLMAVVTGTDLVTGEKVNRLSQLSSKGSLERCGQWNCPLVDYMCPRYEWNRKWVCGSGMHHSTSVVAMLCSLVTVLALAFSS